MANKETLRKCKEITKMANTIYDIISDDLSTYWVERRKHRDHEKVNFPFNGKVYFDCLDLFFTNGSETIKFQPNDYALYSEQWEDGNNYVGGPELPISHYYKNNENSKKFEEIVDEFHLMLTSIMEHSEELHQIFEKKSFFDKFH